MVKGDFVGVGLRPTIGTDGTVSVDEPFAMGLIGTPTRTTELLAGDARG